jgi:hypothetical protein
LLFPQFCQDNVIPAHINKMSAAAGQVVLLYVIAEKIYEDSLAFDTAIIMLSLVVKFSDALFDILNMQHLLLLCYVPSCPR